MKSILVRRRGDLGLKTSAARKLLVRILTISTGFLVWFGCASGVLAACQNSQDCPKDPIRVSYVSLTNGPACNANGTCDDPRATCQSGHCNISLVSWLYLPSLQPPAGGFAAVIFNHGSVGAPPHTAPRACEIVRYFLSRNYAVLTPARRGYAPSTGTYFEDLPDRVAALKDEVNDVKAAFDYLSGGSPLINPNKIAIMGHSIGGAVTIFANELDFGQRVALPIAAGSESWNNETFRNALLDSVPKAKHFTYFFCPQNDVNPLSVVEEGRVAGEDGQQYQSTVFPPVSYATSGEEAHVCFTKDSKMVRRWGKVAVQFLHRYGIE